MRTSTSPETETLVDAEKRPTFDVAEALRQQQTMTPLERFSRDWSEDRIPAQAKYYRDLIPLEAPQPGEQFRFDVDLDRCFGCKSCVSACHHQNGLDDEETWRAVGLLVDAPSDPEPPCESKSWASFQHLTAACHHCVEPACMYGCPTNAYEKDEATGIVFHLDDQCFGCQYCIMACPYQVPQYHQEKGIVRKCDMCRDRLAENEAPACVQACPSQAIQITRVEKASLDPVVDALAPGAPPSTLTTPTTRYTTQRTERLRPIATDPKPEHAHLALVFMLVLTQLSVGLLSAACLLASTTTIALLWSATVSAALGLAAATAHLGRPLLAYRGVLGWRRSWLSREAIAFGAYFGLLTPLTALATFRGVSGVWFTSAVIVTAVIGWLGVVCSAQIYQFTRRVYWSGHRSWLRFALTTILLGAAGALTISWWKQADAAPLAFLLIVLTGLKLVHEFAGCVGRTEADCATRELLWNKLRITTLARITLGVGGVVLPLLAINLTAPTWLPTTLIVSTAGLLVVAELLERTLFFQAVVAWRMPGGLDE